MIQHYVYIMANETRVLYTGMTRDLKRRLSQHRSGHGSKFCRQHKITRLVYVETFAERPEARAREKQIKRGSRAKKIALIESVNPEWEDLGAE